MRSLSDDDHSRLLPKEHRSHTVNAWCRDAAFRGWRVLCSCGSLLEVCESGVDPFNPVAFEDWLDGGGDREVDMITREDGGHRIHWSELQLSPSEWDCVLKEPHPVSPVIDVTAFRGAGKTASQAAWLEATVSFAARISQAMAAMSNAMTCARDAFVHADSLQSRWSLQQAFDRTHWPQVTRDERAIASAEWSRRVRAGVAALKEPGPVVACQGDWDDE